MPDINQPMLAAMLRIPCTTKLAYHTTREDVEGVWVVCCRCGYFYKLLSKDSCTPETTWIDHKQMIRPTMQCPRFT